MAPELGESGDWVSTYRRDRRTILDGVRHIGERGSLCDTRHPTHSRLHGTSQRPCGCLSYHAYPRHTQARGQSEGWSIAGEVRMGRGGDMKKARGLVKELVVTLEDVD